MARMPTHGVSAVVGELGIEPSVQRRDQIGIGSFVSQIHTAFDSPVGDLDLPRLPSLI